MKQCASIQNSDGLLMTARQIAIFSAKNHMSCALAKALQPLASCTVHAAPLQCSTIDLCTATNAEVRRLRQNNAILFLQDRQEYPVERYYSLAVHLRCPPVLFPGPLIVIQSYEGTGRYSQISPAALHCIGLEIMESPFSLAKLLHVLRTNTTQTDGRGFSWPSRDCRPLWSVRMALKDHIHDSYSCLQYLEGFLETISKQLTSEMHNRTMHAINELKNIMDAIEGELGQ